jgi:hypothetical protein
MDKDKVQQMLKASLMEEKIAVKNKFAGNDKTIHLFEKAEQFFAKKDAVSKDKLKNSSPAKRIHITIDDGTEKQIENCLQRAKKNLIWLNRSELMRMLIKNLNNSSEKEFIKIISENKE